jgi:hypothetical protein
VPPAPPAPRRRGPWLATAAIVLVLVLISAVAIATVVNENHLGLSAGNATAIRGSTPGVATTSTTLGVETTTPNLLTTPASAPTSSFFTTTAPQPAPTPATSLAAAVFTVPTMATFARGFFGAIVDCKVVPIDPQKSYTGVDLSKASGTAISCDASSGDTSVPNEFVMFTQFPSLAVARSAMECYDGTPLPNGTGKSPPGINIQNVDLPGTTGSKAGYYCEDAYDDVGPANQIVGVTVGITWTDSVEPIAGHIDLYLPIPADQPTKQYDGSVWTMLRAFWSAHA